MSIVTELQRIQQAKADIKAAIESKRCDCTIRINN